MQLVSPYSHPKYWRTIPLPPCLFIVDLPSPLSILIDEWLIVNERTAKCTGKMKGLKLVWILTPAAISKYRYAVEPGMGSGGLIFIDVVIFEVECSGSGAKIYWLVALVQYGCLYHDAPTTKLKANDCEGDSPFI